MRRSWMTIFSHVGRRSVTNLELTHKELRLLKSCVDKSVPKLVFEHTSIRAWYYCPNCHLILNCEFMQCCDQCGQLLTWHGSTKYAVLKYY